MATVQVRYIVHDVGVAIAFYTEQLGFNLVRLHHHDSPWVSPNVFGKKPADTRTLSAEALATLDWWIKCLEDEGIYVWLDLHVQRQLTGGDGIADFDEISHGNEPVAASRWNATVVASTFVTPAGVSTPVRNGGVHVSILVLLDQSPRLVAS